MHKFSGEENTMDSMKKLLAVNQYAEHILGLAAAARQIARATCLDAHEQMPALPISENMPSTKPATM